MRLETRFGRTGLALCEPPDLPDDHNIRELRIALVCYGGVSLAIYMHGITKELEKLVRASRAFVAADPGDPNPFPATQIEYAYFDALAQKAARDGYRTLVAVDVISGTSAGGINGIYLAKALALGSSQQALRDLWLGRGAILGLLSGRPLPPLAGKRILGWLQAALDTMDGSAQGSLMPPGLTLDLFVTTTDLYGYNRPIPIKDPPFVTAAVNKVVLAFHQRDTVGNLDASHTPALAFAARATSCFPGAFPPVPISEISPAEAQEPLVDEFFRAYELADAPVRRTFFVDGGVLDNYPFRSAVRAIPAKPAATEVERKLLFIEPDPPDPIPPPDGVQPTFRNTVWSALSTLPRRQPIVDALDELTAYNRRVRRVREMIAATTDEVMRQVSPLVSMPYEQANRAANANAIASAGPSYNAYLRLKLYSVVEGMADAICRLLNYPTNTPQNAFVHAALLWWADAQGILAAPEIGESQLEFLRSFDLGYGRRRLTFVIGRIGYFYPDPTRLDKPTFEREPLNRAKRELYNVLCELRTIFDIPAASTIRSDVNNIFGEERIAGPLTTWDIAGFINEVGDEIAALRGALRDYLEIQLQGFGERIHSALLAVTADWPDDLRADVLAHYIGFPYWDAITYPARALSEVGELDQVDVIRVSPLDTDRLEPSPARRRHKLRGIAIHHFGAFFFRGWRENDYLWGRLDGAERLITLLGQPQDDTIKDAFRAIIAEEGPTLRRAKPLIKRVEHYLRQP